ncbi:hypothetical protein NG99_02660 [Erwinia typographi]|uniref:Uncharacterized protein n=1 Tax=Erwinia typographi TaxID=371042 RepID=A0A0A3ZDC9_9GAMM|nr:hypothetical protein [Erwinia typographi]KGT95651.1 hypothetical protein NG99_02660 [Erwinia typographi]
MKTLIAISMLLVASSAQAVSVTLTGPDEEISGNSKICIYEGHGITRTITVRDEQDCPYAKTFDTDEN